MAAEPTHHDRWLLGGDLPCLGCQYNLRGLVGPLVKCPECGQVNDLRDPAPWREKDLPLGVRQREHWPANAVMASLAVGFTIMLWWVAVLEGGWPVIQTPLLLGALALWGGLAWRWVWSTGRPRWALGVLTLLHGSAWLMLAAIPMAMAGPAFLLLFPLGIAGMMWTRHLIGRADRAGRFREDWRRWRLPVNADDPAPTQPPNAAPDTAAE